MVDADDSTAETVEGVSDKDDDARTQANVASGPTPTLTSVTLLAVLGVILLQMTPSSFTLVC